MTKILPIDPHSGELSAWHYVTRQPIHIRWQNGLITTVETAPANTPADLWVAPALFDPQVNGYAGVDFQQDNLTLDQLLTATRALRADGCARFLLTLITDHWPRLITRLRHLQALRAQSLELHSAIAGWHLEGPFLSPEPGFHGAHDPLFMLDPTAPHIAGLRILIGEDPLLLTLAPERPGAIEAISLAVSLGIRVSLGHTNASAETLLAATAAGATGFTHLANGCPRQLDRHDNILWRVLDTFNTPGLHIGLIPDQIHVSPPLFRLIHRLLPLERLCYTTDAMAAAGAPPGRYRLGHQEVEVGPDQIVRQPGRTNFAGSALRPIDGVLRAAQMLQRPWQELWDLSSRAPAAWLGLPAALEPGQPSHLCLLRASSS